MQTIGSLAAAAAGGSSSGGSDTTMTGVGSVLELWLQVLLLAAQRRAAEAAGEVIEAPAPQAPAVHLSKFDAAQMVTELERDMEVRYKAEVRALC